MSAKHSIKTPSWKADFYTQLVQHSQRLDAEILDLKWQCSFLTKLNSAVDSVDLPVAQERVNPIGL